MGLFSFLTETIGIDAGTQLLRITNENDLFFNETAKICIDPTSGKVVGYGNHSTSSKNEVIIFPVNYAIEDFYAFEQLLRWALEKDGKRSFIAKSCILYISIPTNVTQVELRAYRDSAEHCGAKECYMVYQSYCAAINLNILSEKKDFILVDFSASKVEIAVFINGIIRALGTVKLGTAKLFSLIGNYVLRNYQMQLTEKEISDILTDYKKHELQGEFRLDKVVIPFSKIDELLKSYFVVINDEMLKSIESLRDHSERMKVLTNGIYFTGGGMQYSCLIDYLPFDKSIKYTISKTPLMDTINGLKMIIRERKKYKDLMLS